MCNLPYHKKYENCYPKARKRPKKPRQGRGHEEGSHAESPRCGSWRRTCGRRAVFRKKLVPSTRHKPKPLLRMKAPVCNPLPAGYYRHCGLIVSLFVRYGDHTRFFVLRMERYAQCCINLLTKRYIIYSI